MLWIRSGLAQIRLAPDPDLDPEPTGQLYIGNLGLYFIILIIFLENTVCTVPLLFNQRRIGSYFRKICKNYTDLLVSKVGSGSGKIFRIQPGQEVPDPDPQHC